MFVVFDVMVMFLNVWAVAYQPLALGQLELGHGHLRWDPPVIPIAMG